MMVKQWKDEGDKDNEGDDDVVDDGDVLVNDVGEWCCRW